MNDEMLSPWSSCEYICNMEEEEQEQGSQKQESKEKNNNDDNAITVELVNRPRIFAPEKEVNDYLDSLSLDQVGSAEYWFRWCVKKAREKWFDKKFPVKRTTFEQRVAPYIQEELAEIQREEENQRQNQLQQQDDLN